MARRGVPGFAPERLQQHRGRARLSVSELARRSDTSSQNISRYEHGHATPEADRLAAIAAALGIVPIDLVDREQLGNGLLFLRIAAGLTQAQVAERAGPDITVGRYRNLELCVVQRLTHNDARDLARVFNVQTDQVRAAHQWDLNQRKDELDAPSTAEASS